jgi:hypothetical protein
LKRLETHISHRGTTRLSQTSMLEWMRQKFRETESSGGRSKQKSN